MSPVALAAVSIVVAVLSFLGGPVSAFVAVRVALATVSTKLDAGFAEVMRRLDRGESAQQATATTVGQHTAQLAAHEARIAAIERRLSHDRMQAVGGE